jgi:Flp pilus assembly protein protease CpaA
MSAAHGFLLTFLLLGTVHDLLTRTIPNWLTLAGAGVGIGGALLGWWDWSYEWMVLIPVPLWIADVGRGDVKASVVLGGMCGAWAAPVIMLAFGLMIPCWMVYKCGGPYPGDWPFFPLLSGSTCVMLAFGMV